MNITIRALMASVLCVFGVFLFNDKDPALSYAGEIFASISFLYLLYLFIISGRCKC